MDTEKIQQMIDKVSEMKDTLSKREKAQEKAEKDSKHKELVDAIKDSRVSKEEMVKAVSNIKIDLPKIDTPIIPEVKIPEVKLPTINIPEIKIPKIELPTINVPEVIVNVPEIKIPKFPKIEMPDKMTVDGEVSLKNVAIDNPLPVQLRDMNGKPVSLEVLVQGGGGGGFKQIKSSQEGVWNTNALAFNSKTGTYRPLRQDGNTNALQIIDYAHHEIHAGSHFFLVGVQTMANNEVLDFTWQMPNTTKWTHWLWKLDTSVEMEWYIYENVVATNPLANVVTALNSNRNSATASGTTMRNELQANLVAANADTNVTGATLIKSGISGAGRTTGSDSRENELILKQNTLYCLRAVAKAGGYIDFDMEWYEHQNVV